MDDLGVGQLRVAVIVMGLEQSGGDRIAATVTLASDFGQR